MFSPLRRMEKLLRHANLKNAAVLALTAGGHCWAHTGDQAFMDHLYEARMPGLARSSEAQSVQARTDLVREMAGLFSVVPAAGGETLLPPGTVCDEVTLDKGRLTVRFTLPASADPTPLSPLQQETVSAVLVQYFAVPFELSEVLVLGRLAPANGARATGEYRNLVEFAPAPPPLPPEDPDENNGPSYAKLYEALASPASVESDLRRITGQSALGVSTQPAGALSGRTVYIGAGHGWTANGSGGWTTQRPFLLNMCEDYGNIDQVNFFATYLFNAGATVVCMRPLGYQTSEVVLDDSSAGVTFSGSWASATSTYSFGGANSYRYATTAASESAVATYTPNIPAAGFYPVYCFADHGSDRTSGQLYRIKHTGGESLVRINHRRVGRGWIWLGNYYFNAGTNAATGSVLVSNLQPSAGVAGRAVADAIRFGNGMGDINRGGTISGKDREAEASRYWAQKSEAPTSVYDLSGYSDQSDNVGTPPRMAAHMRREDGQGYNGDIYLGWHTNAFNGAARGSVGLITNNASVQNQAAWAALTSNVLDEHCNVEAVNWEHGWGNYQATLTSGYGEIGSGLNGEMCGTIIEVAFHDNAQDAALLRDPKVRNTAARAEYHATLRYFSQFDGLALNYLPEPPQRVRVRNSGSGNVTVGWAPVAALPAPISSGAATGYRVYRSTDGLNFGNPVLVSGNGSNSALVTGLTPGQTWYFRVAAVNAGGESLPSEVLGVRVAGAAAPILIVNGYDRIDKNNNSTVPIDRLRLRQNNSYDYVRQHGSAIAAAGHNFDSCSNEAVIAGDVDLNGYSTVVWICGEESSRDKTLDPIERAKLQSFLGAGKNLFISGSEIGYELDQLNVARSFYNSSLRADLTADASDSYEAIGTSGSLFDGVSVNFEPGADMYNVDSADVLNPANGSVAAMAYGAGAPPVADSFETLGSWQDPNYSGQTNADAASTFQIVSSPVYRGAGAGDLYYVWGAGNRIREFNSTSNTFPYASTFSVWVYGDNSGHTLSLLLRDMSDIELFQNAPIVLNFSGWRQISWNVPSDPVTEFTGAGGDGQITPGAAIKFDSVVLDKTGTPASGHVYVDHATYSTGSGGAPGTAAIQYAGSYRLVYLGFPFEAISDQISRNQVMQSALGFLLPGNSSAADWSLYD